MEGRRFIGHPVDVSDGTVFEIQEDVTVPGRMDLTWERRYTSAGTTGPVAPFGPGWTHSFMGSLHPAEGYWEFFGPDGHLDVFTDPEDTLSAGGVVRNLGSFRELRTDGRAYIVTCWGFESGDVLTYRFEARRGSGFLLTSIDYPNGQGLDLSYHADGRLDSVRQRRESRSVKVVYGAGGLIVALTLVPGDGSEITKATYAYDASGRLASARDAAGHADLYEYDYNSRLTKTARRIGCIFTFQYDDLGRCVWTGGPGGFDSKRLRFLEERQATEVTDSKGGVWLYEWNELGQVHREVSPLGGVKETEFDEHGRVVAVTDPNGRIVAYGYDDRGNLAEMVDEMGRREVREFNDAHQQVGYQDKAGYRWRAEYDGRGYLVRSENPLQESWAYVYDAHGDLVRMIAPDESFISIDYDAAGNNVLLADSKGSTTRYGWDAQGRMVWRVNAVGARVDYEYDVAGNVTSLRYEDGSVASMSYQPGGALSAFTDETGATWRYERGSCGRVVRRVDPVGGAVQYLWGSEPNELLAVVNEVGDEYLFEYDAEGRVVREVRFDGVVRTFDYDAAGKLRVVGTPSGEVRYQRDPSGRVTKRQLPDGREELYGYDPRGLMIEAINHACTVTLDYDALGRPLLEARDDLVTRNTYGMWGRVSRTTPWGSSIRLQWDGDEVGGIELHRGTRLRRETDRVGLTVGLQAGEAFTLRLAYDDRSRVTERRLSDRLAGGTQSWREGHDAAGHLTRRSGANHVSLEVTYDPLHRPRDVRTERSRCRLEYDAATNVVQLDRDGAASSFDYAAGGRLVRATWGNGDITRFAYDADGRVAERQHVGAGWSRRWRYAYDSASRLEAVRSDGEDVARYEYDALGRRIRKKDRTGRAEFLWEGWSLVGERVEGAASASEPREYLFDDFTPLCAATSDHAYFFVSDQVGAPELVIDENGKEVWKGRYDVLGALVHEEERGFQNNVCLPGQYLDRETGLHYNGFRYFDPTVGRYLTPDPIGLEGGVNLYGYVRNPFAYVDPLGLNGVAVPGGPTLPPWKEGDKTVGVLVTESGQTPLKSGYDGPSKGTKNIPGMNGNIKSHVEAHAAAKMRKENIKEATLYINKRPCPTKNPRSLGCDDALERMLPENAKLRVVGPDGFEKVYTGKPDPPGAKISGC